jgi:hypothetical protein
MHKKHVLEETRWSGLFFTTPSKSCYPFGAGSRPLLKVSQPNSDTLPWHQPLMGEKPKTFPPQYNPHLSGPSVVKTTEGYSNEQMLCRQDARRKKDNVV